MTSNGPATLTRSGPTRRRDLTVYELDGEALIFDPRTSDTHRLNATAWFIWRKCDGRRDASTIADALTSNYEVDVDAAREHVARILGEFQTHGLVTIDHDRP